MATVNIISLGCPRNQLDSEIIAGSLKKTGFSITAEREGADVCVINTCAFIQSAREESVEKILEAVDLKKKGRIGRLVICGCLSQLYKEKLAAELGEVDLVLGTSDFPRLPEVLKKRHAKKTVVSPEPHHLYDDRSPRIISTPPHYAYLKISEGCSNFCSYCIISRLRGPFRSRSIDSVLKEVKALSKTDGLKELILIGQDTTLFGIDRYGKAILGELLRRICALENNIEWIRILYTHPAHYTDDFISVVRSEDRICKYLDLPIQHISDKILKKMNRRVTKKEIINLIEKLRKNIPGLVLRTSIIVGFPGETDKEFKELTAFLRDTKFDRLGAFIYSKEDRTRASRLDKQVPDKVKKERFDILMKLQQDISRGINKKYVGRVVDVLIDEKCEDVPSAKCQAPGTRDKGPGAVFLGRTKGDAPEIDGVVYVTGENIKKGNIYKVRIEDALEYDLVGNKVAG